MVVALAATNVERNQRQQRCDQIHQKDDTTGSSGRKNTNTIHKDGAGGETIVETAILPWGYLNAMEYSDCADLVVGSDLTYNSASWRVLGETIGTICKPNGGRFLYLTCGHSGFGVKGELDGFVQVVASSQGSSCISLVVDAAMGTKLERELLTTLSDRETSIVDSTCGFRVLVLQRKS